MEIQGKIIQKLNQQSGISQRSGQAWKKQEYVLETMDRFPRKVLFHFFGEYCDAYPLEVGDNVNVSFDLESRSYIGRDGVERWSTDVRAYRADKVDIQVPQNQFGAQQPMGGYQQPMQQPMPMGQQPVQPMQPAPAVGQFPTEAPAGDGSVDNLPF